VLTPHIFSPMAFERPRWRSSRFKRQKDELTRCVGGSSFAEVRRDASNEGGRSALSKKQPSHQWSPTRLSRMVETGDMSQAGVIGAAEVTVEFDAASTVSQSSSSVTCEAPRKQLLACSRSGGWNDAGMCGGEDDRSPAGRGARPRGGEQAASSSWGR